jgi:hypothetical protein
VNKFKAKMPHIEMCNLSIGYFNAHSDNEYLDIKYFNEIVDKVEHILNTFKDTYIDDQVDKPTTYDRYDKYYNKDIFDDVEYCDNCGCVIPRGSHWETVTGFKCCSRECRDELEDYLQETEETTGNKDD